MNMIIIYWSIDFKGKDFLALLQRERGIFIVIYICHLHTYTCNASQNVWESVLLHSGFSGSPLVERSEADARRQAGGGICELTVGVGDR